MPKHEEFIALNNIDASTAIALGYQALKLLKWNILFAGEDKILGCTPKMWKGNGQQIYISIEDNQLVFKSELVDGEIFDAGGKNKKNAVKFKEAFEEVKNSIDSNLISANTQAIYELQKATQISVEEEQNQISEVDKAMNLSGSNLRVTYAIMAVNVVIFILMAINGAGIFESNGYVHIKWGSNYAPLTLTGDWWRLITSVFLHYGIIHLAMNMYCLYTVGVYLEPMFGKVKYTAAYLCTGILASVVSLWWHKEPVNSAGASGAVFGLYGLFLALLTTNLIPQHFRKSLLQSIALFIVFNLFYGLKGGVDNAAHIGGLLSGFIVGYIYVVGIKKEKQQQKVQWITPTVVIITLLSAFGYLQLNKISLQTRLTALNAVTGASFKDFDKYNEKMNEVSLKETAALEALRGTDSITREEFVSRLNQALPIWDTIADITKSAANYKVSEANHKRAEKLLEYVLLRKKQYNLLIVINKSSVNNEDIATNKELEETNEKVSKIVDELNTL